MNRIKYRHLGTDCSHKKHGMCDRCKNPRAVHPLPGWRPFALLKALTTFGVPAHQSWDWGVSPLRDA